MNVTLKVIRLIEIDKALAKVKALYSEREKLISEILETTAKREFHTPIYSMYLLDNFETKHTAYRATHFSRYEVVVQRRARLKK